jgi:hypothetical protein
VFAKSVRVAAPPSCRTVVATDPVHLTGLDPMTVVEKGYGDSLGGLVTQLALTNSAVRPGPVSSLGQDTFPAALAAPSSRSGPAPSR